jgi:D-alanyl-D-alanine carboxypeptidase
MGSEKGAAVRRTVTVFARGKSLSVKSILVMLLALAFGAALPATSHADKYAAVVIDANTGKTLFAAKADASRYPASLTKMMTLFLTFDALQAGKIDKSTKITFSKNAAAEPPTKLGVRAGGSVSVETIIYSLVTKSANDSATAIAEHLGGSEEAFARMMTAKARQLGMTGTVFRNAHGLPDSAQHSTARDMAMLGIALREHFPQYYSYFSTRSFKYGKKRMANHNRLLGRIKGVDGIKTGYTRASGFNLVSSVSNGDRRIVATVMGGKSGASRDRHMAELIKKYMPKASSRKGGPLVARTASPIEAIVSALLPGKNAPTPDPRPEILVAADTGTEPTVRTHPADPAPVLVEHGYAEPIAARMADIDPVATASVQPPAGWAVQVASSPSEIEARAFLAKTNKQAASILADASSYTVTFDKDGVTYYRARFGGFETKGAAWDACNALKKRKIACYAVLQ